MCPTPPRTIQHHLLEAFARIFVCRYISFCVYMYEYIYVYICTYVNICFLSKDAGYFYNCSFNT